MIKELTTRERKISKETLIRILEEKEMIHMMVRQKVPIKFTKEVLIIANEWPKVKSKLRRDVRKIIKSGSNGNIN